MQEFLKGGALSIDRLIEERALSEISGFGQYQCNQYVYSVV